MYMLCYALSLSLSVILTPFLSHIPLIPQLLPIPGGPQVRFKLP